MQAATLSEAEIHVEGMGAVVHPEGVHFRVWAPHASSVYVTGTFNKWAKKKTPLIHEENGYWAINVPTAKIGQEYKYIIHNGKTILQKNDPYAREVTNSTGNSVISDPAFDWEDDEQFQMPPWNRMVIYELHIGTFHVKEEGKPGDFYTAIERLSYLKALGINAVEIMPPFEFAGDYSWGYNPAHPFAIESAYGGPRAFKEFVKAAHRYGIAVLLDVVYNHFGPSDIDLWQFDGWSENDKGGIYFYNDWRSTTPWGDTRPDYGRGEVRQYIRDNALMWLEEYHCDGLRMDMIPYIRNVYADENPDSNLNDGYTLIQWINREISEKYPWKFTVAEDLHGLDAITQRVEHGGLGYSSQWDADFVHPIRDAIITMRDEDRDMYAVENAILRKYNNDAFQRVVYTESHDEVANGKARVAEEIAAEDVNNWYSKKRSTLGVALAMTVPGIPMLFQGQELLEDKWFTDTDPIDWSRLSEFKGLAKMFRDLIHLRQDRYANTLGLTGQHSQTLHLNNEGKVIAFHRWNEGGPGDSVVVIANFSGQAYEHYHMHFPAAGVWRVRFNSDWEGYDSEFDSFPAYDVHATADKKKHIEGNLKIPAYSIIILSQDK